MGNLFYNRYTQGGVNMIWCVEDDGGIRDIEIYALNSAGFETKGTVFACSVMHDACSFQTYVLKPALYSFKYGLLEPKTTR